MGSNTIGLETSNWWQAAMQRAVPSRLFGLALTLPGLVALGVSGYLTYVALTSTPVFGCGGSDIWDCGHVISTRWSKWLGVPVSLLAMGIYTVGGISLILANSGSSASRHRHVAWMLVTLLGLAAGMAAVWFISLQVFAVQHLCSYCLVAHSCGILLTIMLVWRHPFGWRATGMIAVGSALGLSVLVGGQILTEPPVTYEIEEFPDEVTNASSMGTDAENEALIFGPPDEEDKGSPLDEADDTIFTPPADEPSDPEGDFSMLNLPAGLAHSNLMMSALFVHSLPHIALTMPGGSGDTMVAKGRPQDDQKTDDQDQEESTDDERLVSINGGRIKLGVDDWPMAGSSDAKYILVEMFDYTCPHCRNTHRAIEAAFDKFGDDFALMALPVPLNSACNSTVRNTSSQAAQACELGELAVAVWRVDAGKFREFHDWMFAGSSTPRYASAKSKAESIVGAEPLREELAKNMASKYISRHVDLYRRVGAGTVPKIFFPRSTITGEYTSGRSLIDRIEREMD